ncbi:MAG: UTP--glucose-1-phosphate uridylyltransferase [Candidatus Marinamargulisbacteria bacterium]
MTIQAPPEWMTDWFERAHQEYHTTNRTISSLPQPLPKKSMVPYDALPHSTESSLRVAMVKLNGGLGTSMGCQGPKSLVAIDQQGTTFLDRIIQQSQTMPGAVPLILLNSFNTVTATMDYMNTHAPDTPWQSVFQHAFKKIHATTGQPLSGNDPSYFNPPGHGSVYYDLYHAGVLHELQAQGVSYVFISNADNLAATCDPKIMAYLEQHAPPFLMELTPKRASDCKGGTVVCVNDQLTLWEVAQVPEDQMDWFQSQPVFNTYNLWASVSALIQAIESDTLRLDLIKNKKTLGGAPIIQLEYAMGSAIQSFEQAKVMIVPRQRFFPIKKTNDLLRLVSDYCDWTADGSLRWDTTHELPIELGPPFETLDGFFRQFQHIPSIKRARSIHISGDVTFNVPIQLSGDVSIKVSSPTRLSDLGEFNSI